MKTVYPASIHAKKEHVIAYRNEFLKPLGLDHAVVTVPAGSAAYHMGYRFTTCARDELADYIAGGATLAEPAAP